jgi:dipeptidase E
MTGVVYLGGGGSGDDEGLLWQRMLGSCQRLLYWPLALEGDMLAGAEMWLRDQLQERGFSAQVETWTSLEGKDPADLKHFDLLFVGGGNTFFLLHQLQTHGFIEPVRQWVDAGGNYYGGSAGAILATDSIEIAEHADSNDVGLVDLTGLGLLPAIGLLPHYTVDQQEVAQAISGRLNRPVIGVPEAAGLVVENGAVETVGPQPVWTITTEGAIRNTPGHSLSFT